MKKIALFFFMLTAWFSTTYGQNRDLRFGFQASPAWTWMRSDQNKVVEGNGANWSFKLGMVGEKYFRANYAIVSGINFFFNAGGTLKYSGDSLSKITPLNNSNSQFPIFTNTGKLPKFISGDNVHYRLQYVEIPLALKMRGGSGEDSYLNFFAEVPMLTLGFRTKALADVRETKEEGAIKGDIKAITASWGLGAGVEYNISSSTALVGGLYYQQGFFDATNDDGVRSTVRGLTVRIGVLF